ncbi:MAG: sugar phosphate isomerase/epimerase family protein [Clostridiales bacterium]|nr:sugar phosphate isomerase/epimerase family protein [Clostridiales bacterium]
MKFSCQDKLLPGLTQTEKYLNAAEVGFDSIEVNARSVDDLKERVDEIKKATAASGISPSTICGGYRGWIGHFEKDMRTTAIKDIKALLPLMNSIGATGVIVPAAYGMFSKKLPPNIPPRGEDEDRKVLVESLSILGEAAAGHNITIIFEPLNRYEDHMVNTVGQAVDIIKLVNNPSVMAMIDFFHANLEESDLSVTIHKFNENIKHVHLADSNRMQPGKGHIDFIKPFKALKDVGFDGYCALECNIIGEGSTPLKETLDYLKSCI